MNCKRTPWTLGFAIMSAASLLSSTAHADPGTLRVRVDASNGAPRLTVNGVPVRARFFYGQPASGTLHVSETGTRQQFEFVADRDVDAAGTLHFRFGQRLGDIYLSGLNVTDITAQKVLIENDFHTVQPTITPDWRSWPPAEQNTVAAYRMEAGQGEGGAPALHISLHNPANGTWPDFHIYHEANLTLRKGHRYRVSVWLKSDSPREVTTAFYKPGTTYQFLGGPPGHYESQVKLAASAGVNFVSFSIPMPWPAPGESEDWSGVDSVIETTLGANPNALMLPRIPIYAPQWWLQAHPDEKMAWENGDHGGIATPASALFAQDASQRLARLIDHIEAKYGSHIAGYHPNGQNTGEWFYMDSWEHPLNGYSPADKLAYQQWLHRKYGTIAQLNRAYKAEFFAFDAISVPAAAVRHSAPYGMLRAEAAELPVLDFCSFQQDSMADLVCQLAKVVRTHTGGRKLVAFFFGYLYEFAAIPTGPASSGHYALRKLLNSPDIDVLCSPISYFDRGPGMSAPCMTAAESVALAGKMWLNEDDTRTYLTREDTFPGAEHKVTTLAETNGELVRNVAQEASRNFATWWMDLPASGWFDDPGMWAEMKRLNKMDSELLRLHLPFRPEIADVIDPQALVHVAEGGAAMSRPAVYDSRAAFGRVGAPYGQYLLEDVLASKVHARLMVFNSPWNLNKTQAEQLRRATAGMVKVWMYAAGKPDSEGLLKVAPSVCGFQLAALKQARSEVTPTQAGLHQGLSSKPIPTVGVKPLYFASDA
jgi:beta-galactosidase